MSIQASVSTERARSSVHSHEAPIARWAAQLVVVFVYGALTLSVLAGYTAAFAPLVVQA